MFVHYRLYAPKKYLRLSAISAGAKTKERYSVAL